MSRLIRSPIVVDSAKFSFSKDRSSNLLMINFSGSNYKCHLPKLSDVKITESKEENKTYLKFEPLDGIKTNSKYAASLKMNVANMINDLSKNFSMELTLAGVGFKVEKKESFLCFSIGYSHKVFYKIPESIDIEIVNNAKFNIIGLRDACSLYASKLSKIRKYNPYGKTGIIITGKFYLKKDVKKSV